jgi:protein-tyrosine phosphatase
MRHHIFTENQRNFIISGTPSDSIIDEYISLLQKNSINLVINLTESNNRYNTEKIKNINIDYLHFPIEDGNILTDEKIKHFIAFLYRYNSIAFHCQAGLGRAPLMCAIGFIILFNYKPLDAITKIREKEKLAFNTIQLTYLTHFKRNKYISKSCIIS